MRDTEILVLAATQEKGYTWYELRGDETVIYDSIPEVWETLEYLLPNGGHIRALGLIKDSNSKLNLVVSGITSKRKEGARGWLADNFIFRSSNGNLTKTQIGILKAVLINNSISLDDLSLNRVISEIPSLSLLSSAILDKGLYGKEGVQIDVSIMNKALHFFSTNDFGYVPYRRKIERGVASDTESNRLMMLHGILNNVNSINEGIIALVTVGVKPSVLKEKAFFGITVHSKAKNLNFYDAQGDLYSEIDSRSVGALDSDKKNKYRDEDKKRDIKTEVGKSWKAAKIIAKEEIKKNKKIIIISVCCAILGYLIGKFT